MPAKRDPRDRKMPAKRTGTGEARNDGKMKKRPPGGTRFAMS